MKALARGRVRADTVLLDNPVPLLEGKAVQLTLEPLDEAEPIELQPEELARLWEQWVHSGPQGPIDEDANAPQVPMIARGTSAGFRFQSPGKRRPVLVLGCDEILSSLHEVPVIPLSTQARGLRWEVGLSSQSGRGPSTNRSSARGSPRSPRRGGPR